MVILSYVGRAPLTPRGLVQANEPYIRHQKVTGLKDSNLKLVTREASVGGARVVLGQKSPKLDTSDGITLHHSSWHSSATRNLTWHALSRRRLHPIRMGTSTHCFEDTHLKCERFRSETHNNCVLVSTTLERTLY